MDSSISTMDSLDDTTVLPELSFDDLLDVSPLKKDARSSLDDDPLDLEREGQAPHADQTLNTPKPKKATGPQPSSNAVVAISSVTTIVTPSTTLAMTLSEFIASNPTIMTKTATSPMVGASGSTTSTTSTRLLSSPAATAAVVGKQVTLSTSDGGKLTFRATPTTMQGRTTTGGAAATPKAASPIILNSRKLLQGMTIQSATGGSPMRILTRPDTASTVTSSARSTTTPAAAAIMSGKVAVKAPNGKILYIQKTSLLRTKSSDATTLRGAATATTAPTTSTTTLVGTTTVKTTSAIEQPLVSETAIAPKTATIVSPLPGPVVMSTAMTPKKPFPSKTVSIQFIRKDGAPIKSTAAGSGATLAKKTLTLTPAIASQLAGKKVSGIPSSPVTVSTTVAGGQLIISGPLKGLSTLAGAGGTAVTSSSPSAAAAAAAAATTGKMLQTPVVVTNQSLIKLPTKPASVGGGGGGGVAVSSGTAGKIQTIQLPKGLPMQTIQIPGKGLQQVRVLPKINSGTAGVAVSSGNIASTTATTAIVTNASSSSSSSGSTSTTNSVNTSATVKCTASVVTPPSSIKVVGGTGGSRSIQTGSVSASSMIKLLNTKKFTVVRPNTATGKFMLASTSKTEGGNTPVTFTPVTSKVQKTIVSVPTLRTVAAEGDHKKSPVTPTSSKSIRIVPAFNPSGSGGGQFSAIRKHKISDLNTEIHRITSSSTTLTTTSGSEEGDSGPPLKKKTAGGGNTMVLVSRTMLLPPRPASIVQRLPVQSTSGNNKNSANSSSTHTNSGGSITMTGPQEKKYFSVLKGTTAEMKSRIICSQAQAQMYTQQSKNLQHQSRVLHKFQQQIKRVTLLSQSQPWDGGASTSAAAKKAAVMVQELLNAVNGEKDDTGINRSTLKIKEEPMDVEPSLEQVGGAVRRKHCNCSKSQCLKLYCDCFANGEFCQNCTCKDCFNNLQYEDERQRAIKNCLERNPSAFKPKITSSHDQGDMRHHNKGCNCKRSGCLKNYCECYEAKIPCSSNCKCVGCRNVEDRPDLDMDPVYSKLPVTTSKPAVSIQHSAPKRTYERSNFKHIDKSLRDEQMPSLGRSGDDLSGAELTPEKSQVNFITPDVIDATIQCMISQADECEKSNLAPFQTEKLIMEELGRCLVEIIDFSIRNTDSSFSQE